MRLCDLDKKGLGRKAKAGTCRSRTNCAADASDTMLCLISGFQLREISGMDREWRKRGTRRRWRWGGLP
jgi:hypothetical protein